MVLSKLRMYIYTIYIYQLLIKFGQTKDWINLEWTIKGEIRKFV